MRFGQGLEIGFFTQFDLRDLGHGDPFVRLCICVIQLSITAFVLCHGLGWRV
jgi:hypothetical protein